MRLGLLMIFLAGWGFGLCFPPPVWGYSYGPACQWIHLIGKIQAPQGREGIWPVKLTVTYQLPSMAHPATLLTNYPLEGESFRFFLAGLDEKIDGAILISPMFFFAKEIVFRYYARSSDGSLATPWHRSVFRPPNIPQVDLPKNKGKTYRCDTGIRLDALELR